MSQQNLRQRSQSTLQTPSGEVSYFRLAALEEAGLTTLASLPFSIRVLAENALRNLDGYLVTEEDIEAVASWKPGSQSARVVPVHAGPRADAGPHRRTRRRGPGCDAVGDGPRGRRLSQGQPDRARGPGHRPLRASRLLRRPKRLPDERREGVRAQSGALHLSPLGAERLRQLHSGATRHRHSPTR